MEDLNNENIGDEKARRYAKESLIRGVNNKKHICETLRLIYDQAVDDPKINNQDYIEELLIDAMVMAKKMQDRLSYYQKKYKDNTGNKAINIVGLTGVRARAKMRKARKI